MDVVAKVLVLGGTGLAGRAVVDRLAAAGAYVSVLSRRGPDAAAGLAPTAEVFTGSATDEGAVEAAMSGCSGVHLSLDGGTDPDLERRAAELVARLAPRLGVSRITLMSGASVAEQNAWFPGVAAKLAAQRAVQGSGVPFAVFRSSFLMESLPRYVRGNRASAIGRQPTPWHWVAADDLARMVARTHADPAISGEFTILGPQPLTLEAALREYVDAVVPQAKVGTLPFWLASVMSRLPGADGLAAALPFARYTAKVDEVGDPAAAASVFGPASTTLAEWCRRASA
jgi:uncharacterized protein YbjT (DUF2867 family)